MLRMHRDERRADRGDITDIERRLESSVWIASAEFTVADIMMACVLRGVRKTDVVEPFPRFKAVLRALLQPPRLTRAGS